MSWKQWQGISEDRLDMWQGMTTSGPESSSNGDLGKQKEMSGDTR